MLVVYVLDLYEREPMSLLVAAFVWGASPRRRSPRSATLGGVSTVARLGGPEFAARWTAALTAPFVEEILKGCGVVLIYLIARDEVDDVMDGFVYGAICGLGFAVVEDVFYFMAVFGGQPRRRAAGLLRCGSWRAGSTATCCTRGSSGMAIGRGRLAACDGRLRDTGSRSPRGLVRARRVRPLPVELAAP